MVRNSHWFCRSRMRTRYLVASISVSLTVILLVSWNSGLPSLTSKSRFFPGVPVSYIGAVPVEGSDEGFAHLQFPRRDLDKSNYTSGDDLSKDVTKFSPKNVAENAPQLPEQRRTEPTRFQPTEDTRERISRLYRKAVLPQGVDLLQLNKHYSATERWPFHHRRGRPLAAFRQYQRLKFVKNWERFHLGIHEFSLYDPDEDYINGLISDIQREKITKVVMKKGGTQLKLVVTFADESQALLKPMRYDRTYETPPNHFYFSDFERHNAEIAAYHVDRVMGFYRSPPVVGRKVNITSELRKHADKAFAKTIFVSPAENVCFTGVCSYYCDTGHAFCGRPDIIEGSFAAFLPSLALASRVTYRNPWRRSYSKHKQADWEIHEDYCDTVKNISLYRGTKRMLDLMDLTIYDFIIGNMDRHHYEVFPEWGNDSFIVHLDHGRSFGRVSHDEITILTPIRQCCLVRRTTFLKLISFHYGPTHLGDALRRSLVRDRLSPILVDGHFEAVDRRVAKVLVAIATCVDSARSPAEVVVDDGF